MAESGSTVVVEGLRRVFADTYALYLKTQNYHWNVTGHHFASLHAMFEAQYQELAEALDALAERLRILGEFAPGTFGEIQSLSSIKDGNPSQSADLMVGDLFAGHGAIIRRISELIPASVEGGDEGTVGLLSERLASHEKTAWMLRSTLT
ncbi:Dps family protein [Thalassoglobus sp.]|uniref:Dps family protein n=1 Tax=Thalassoglobus sp. TaxID=2795869 RepID=UPI003AA7E73D